MSVFFHKSELICALILIIYMLFLFQKLAEKYCEELKIDKNICITVLKELQKHALDKLHDKDIYNKTGVAVIKVKLSSGNNSSNNINTSHRVNDSNNNSNNALSNVGRILSIHINLSSFPSAVMEAVSEKISVSPER